MSLALNTIKRTLQTKSRHNMTNKLRGMTKLSRLSLVSALLIAFTMSMQAARLKGRVIDQETGEALIGATVRIVEAGKFTATDTAGMFTINGLGDRNYTLMVSYISYRSVSFTLNPARQDTLLVIGMSSIESAFNAAVVTAKAKKNTENAIVSIQQNALVVQNGVSAQQIRRTQDKDASEVIRRVPGISIIDNKFVMKYVAWRLDTTMYG